MSRHHAPWAEYPRGSRAPAAGRPVFDLVGIRSRRCWGDERGSPRLQRTQSWPPQFHALGDQPPLELFQQLRSIANLRR